MCTKCKPKWQYFNNNKDMIINFLDVAHFVSLLWINLLKYITNSSPHVCNIIEISMNSKFNGFVISTSGFSYPLHLLQIKYGLQHL
jgi:hypothetical protein